MASRELQPRKDSSIELDDVAVRWSPELARTGDSVADVPFVFAALRRCWWMIAICLLISAITAYIAASKFSHDTATTRGSLIYRGLPLAHERNVYTAPSLITYRQILFSTPNMQRICNQRGLDIEPSKLADLFQCTIKQGSNIMELDLTWSSAEQCVAIMNDTMQLMIDEAARLRKTTLQEYMKHVEGAQLNAKAEIDAASRQLRTARRNRDALLGAGATTDSKYGSVLERVTNTQASIDALMVNQLGVQQKISRLEERAKEILNQLQREQLNARTAEIERALKPFSKDNDRWTQLRDIYTRLRQFAAGDPPTINSYASWKSKLADIGRDVLPAPSANESAEVKRLEDDLRVVVSDREKQNLELIPIANQLKLLQKRLQDYGKEATELADRIASVDPSDVEVYEKRVLEAETLLRRINEQLDDMRQLEECRMQEFAVAMPASLATTEIGTNMRKLFVLVFFAISPVLAAPILCIDWLAHRECPVTRFGRKWGVPVLAERLLTNYAPHARQPVDCSHDDEVRMATLRIQQCISNSGGVVLFSTLGETPAPVRLISSIAECLAKREERVLLVDAIDPTIGGISLTSHGNGSELGPRAPVSTSPKNGSKPTNGELAIGRVSGLSEYLSRDCQGVSDLIRPTSCPGVDLISAGNAKFPHEAMASSCITELFQHCRNSYSMILVAGPPATARADFQMLAARADAIVLGASRRALRDSTSPVILQDLIELNAPLIGIVG